MPHCHTATLPHYHTATATATQHKKIHSNLKKNKKKDGKLWALDFNYRKKDGKADFLIGKSVGKRERKVGN
jgi:hypothetical protein